jgi:ribosomal protein S12
MKAQKTQHEKKINFVVRKVKYASIKKHIMALFIRPKKTQCKRSVCPKKKQTVNSKKPNNAILKKFAFTKNKQKKNINGRNKEKLCL